MTKIALTPNANGTGTFTIAAPNSNTNRTLTLPDEADPIAMQMLRDGATKEEWLAKIDEIKARFPYPEEV